MSPTKRILLAALCGAIAPAATLHLIQRSRGQEANRLRQENNRIRYAAAVRGPTGARANPAGPAQGRAAATPTPPAAGPTNADGDYRDAGRATPQATFQTFAWACARGEAARVEQLLWFEESARHKAQAFMASLPESARREWPTPEAMAAALFVADAAEHPFPAATVLEKATPAPFTPDRVLLELPGAGPLREHTEYVKTGDSWSYVITEAAVDVYIARTQRRR